MTLIPSMLAAGSLLAGAATVSGDLTLSLGFDREKGLVLEEFGNTARDMACRGTGETALPLAVGQVEWTAAKTSRREDASTGRRTEITEIRLASDRLDALCRLTAYPDASVIRIAYELTAKRDGEFEIARPQWKWTDRLRSEAMKVVVFRGGADLYSLGEMVETRTGLNNDGVLFESFASMKYAPLMIVEPVEDVGAGFLFAADTLDAWKGDFYRWNGWKSVRLGPEGKRRLKAGETWKSPEYTLATYAGDRDNLMRVLYDWQYRYFWDYTNPDYFGKIRGVPNWVYPGRNVHEQFTWRLARYEAEQDRMRAAGSEVAWDDAGWSVCETNFPPNSYHGVRINNFEGPDYMMARRLFRKSGLKQLIWFGRKHDLGVLEGKHGAWGEFEWRTDMFYELPQGAAELRDDIVAYLDRDGDRSFHTCNCGSTYSLMFDIQRYAGYNYLADGKEGPYHNAYLSYFTVPDKMADLILFISARDEMNPDGSRRGFKAEPDGKGDYLPEFARSRLSMVPIPCGLARESQYAAYRYDTGLYRYLRRRGVAGKGTYMYHPEHWGVENFCYRQRVSADRRRGVLIQAFTPRRKGRVFPRGLLPDERYEVSFQNRKETFARTGREIMDDGFDVSAFTDGELVYFNLSDHPGSGKCPRPGQIPSVSVRAEENIDRSGVGIYWSPCPGDADDFYYEIAKDGREIGVSAFGCYWFDREAGAFPAAARYAVRAVNYDGIRGPWREARLPQGEAEGLVSVLGDFGADMAAEGWAALYSADGRDFRPMKWVAPVRSASADIGGTPNQEGGIEGYYEGGTCARVGRGWFQADTTGFAAMRYKVSRSGRIAASGRAMKEFYHRRAGGPIEAFVLRNGRRLSGGTIGNDDPDGFQHDLDLEVEAGDELLFVVGPGGGERTVHHSIDARLVGWLPRIAYRESAKREARQPVVTLADFGRSRRVERTVSLRPDVYDVKMTYRVRQGLLFDENVIRVSLNGETVEKALDLRAFSRGREGEVVRFYRCRLPDAEGKMTIRLEGGGDLPLDRIDIAPVGRSTVRINCGADADFVDWAGAVWRAGVPSGGMAAAWPDARFRQVTPTLYDQALYRTAAVGESLRWEIPVESGLYAVQLKLAEPEQDGGRKMDVFINGRKVRAGYDVLATTGHVRQAADVRFEGVVPVDGKIAVEVKAAGAKPALVQAIMVE